MKNYFWDVLHGNLKEKIKNQVLSTLIDKNMNIMRAGANVISSIATIEIPRGEWHNMI